jgi:hypothetical protein
LAFAVKEQWVLADYSRQFFVRVCVTDQHVSLLPYQMVVQVDLAFCLYFAQVFELSRHQACQSVNGHLRLDPLQNQELHARTTFLGYMLCWDK